jgi:hypothetical protein
MQAGQAALDRARDALRKGLLDEAALALRDVPPAAPASERAASALLAGNLAYERGRYADAQAAWRGAAALYAEASDAEGHATALSNLELAGERIARRAALQARADTLQSTALVLLCAAALALALLTRRSSP